MEKSKVYFANFRATLQENVILLIKGEDLTQKVIKKQSKSMVF